ncbi:Proline-rich receptor protein kinase PERK10 isoform 1 [Hibiscus syriacus]|uniref:Proline-rich receptor protein kinase PERK10 isoform 1 n=1 Tax=Hibiscus syriacus TaxID=106335 RepID=A0A6A2X2Y5_HIBSY|nr:Proline-rich receptor protein kinase PERK10 isoform 1 [Hibiscus syriacus]
MEDCNVLIADCVVICCCSQCLILQIIIFVFLKLPCKLIRKTKRYAKKLIGGWRPRKEGGKIVIEVEMGNGGLFKDEVQLVRKRCDCMMSKSVELREGGFGEGQYGIGYCCMQEVEKVLEELSRQGEFAFGSF